MRPSVSVVHLIWIPYGIQLFKDFIESYEKFYSGEQHEFILLFNGISNPSEADDYHTYVQKKQINYQFHYYDSGQDLEAYHWIAEKLSTDYILFLNSYSRLLADNWLLKIVAVLDQFPETGMIAATGSWQSHLTSIFETNSWKWSNTLTFKGNIGKYKLLLKAFFLWRFYFKRFPNPHLRTNGFFINRKLFVEVRYKNPVTKFDAYRIESGKQSITQQVIQKGFNVFLIDKSGNVFSEKNWQEAKTFWTNTQENLLISDNQTRFYEFGTLEEKEHMRYSAWGK